MRSEVAGREQTTILCEEGLSMQEQRRGEVIELVLAGVGEEREGFNSRASCTGAAMMIMKRTVETAREPKFCETKL